MDTKSLRVTAAIILLPSVFLALLPPLAQYTSLLNGMSTFHLEVLGYQLADFHKDLNGAPIAQSAWPIWVVALIGELLLLSSILFQSHSINRHKLTMND